VLSAAAVEIDQDMAVLTLAGTPVPVTVGGWTRWNPLLVKID
jgi:hypothetical protein